MATDERKLSGYLEKKGKMKMMSSWKNYWFVLEGRLLLYYRSKDEYESLSPCKGSINLGPTCTVKPLLGTSCVFQIETRANTIILKAKTRLDQEKWMHAVLAALNQTSNTNGMIHFRYSSDELMPRRNPEHKCEFSRQYTLPQRLNVGQRHTFCRSFETLQPNFRKEPGRNKIRSTNDVQSLMSGENNTLSSTTLAGKNRSIDIIMDNDVYGAISPPAEQERELLRKKSSKANSEHIYERISGESKISSSSKEIIENDTYVTTSDINSELIDSEDICIDNEIYNKKVQSVDDDILLENDQYCTPDIIVRNTDLVSYHEYNLPEKEKHIYSVPNFDNTDHNENRISQSDSGVNPYSVCHIYPKKQDAQKVADEKVNVYDDLLEYAVPSQEAQSSNVTKLLHKFKKIATAKEKEKKTPIAKKRNFLQKMFKKSSNKKKVPEIAVEETEYVEIDERAVKKMDMAYCIDKKILTELELILHRKKQHLQQCAQANEEQDKENPREDKKPTQHAEDKNCRPKIPDKPRKKKHKVACESTKQDEGCNHLQTIDEILDNLEEMKFNNTLTSGRVKHLVEKFDKTIKKQNLVLRQNSNAQEYDIVLRRKELNQELRMNSHNSNDELNRLLCELAKVTNAPILTPGVTCSLAVTSRTNDPEFFNLACKAERRLSEPDYDIPRPHTNLQICRDNEDTDDALTATRFFGPVLPNYDREVDIPPPVYSMTPDSLEPDISASNFNTISDVSMPSYSSHKYEAKIKSTKLPVQKHVPKEDVFIDSLEFPDETLTIL